MSVSEAEVLGMLEGFRAVEGVRGALIASEGAAYAGGRKSGLEPSVANDIAKTALRMVEASSTVGAPLEELSINFGVARMMIIPLCDDATLVIVLERDRATAPLRSLLAMELEGIASLFTAAANDRKTDLNEKPEGDDDVGVLMKGPLGSVLREVEEHFSRYLGARNISKEEASALMKVQVREWLLCCNPSIYTFPLLVDGLAQALDDDPEVRAQLVSELHDLLKRSGSWKEKTM